MKPAYTATSSVYDISNAYFHTANYIKVKDDHENMKREMSNQFSDSSFYVCALSLQQI
jgi:hypothetical protein